MKCNVCSTEITNPAAVFCPNCGAKLNAAEQAAPKDPAPAPGPAAAAAAASMAAKPEPKPVDPRQALLFQEERAPIVSTGNWLGSLLILFLVPIALSVIAGLVSQLVDNNVLSTVLSVVAALSGLILMFWFAFGKRFNPSKRNFFKAYLILTLIAIVLCIVLGLFFFSYLTSHSSELTELTNLINNLT